MLQQSSQNYQLIPVTLKQKPALYFAFPKHINSLVMIVISVQIFVHLVVLRLVIGVVIKFHVVLNIQVPHWLNFGFPREFPPLFVTLNFVSFLALHAHEFEHFEAFMYSFAADKA